MDTETGKLSTSNLSAGYEKVVVDGVCIDVRGGEIVAILGPNGAGKSTLLKALASILKPVKGVVYINGRNIRTLNTSELAKNVSVILTEKVDAGFMTGFEVAALGRYPYSDTLGRLSYEDERIVEECLELVNAKDLASKPFSEMSDGEKQKVMIARALAQMPKVMLLDEPTSFLDARHRMEIMLLLRRIAERGVAILLTTHDVELALRLCDRVVLLSKGKVICSGEPEAILKDDLLSKIYMTNKAKFSEKLGAFEIAVKSEPQIHVVCGGGTGYSLMRFLARKGIAFTAGVLHAGDVDCCVAEICAVRCTVERAFNKISLENLEKTKKLAEGKVVVDSAFPVGELNAANLRIFEVAKVVLSFRDRNSFEKLCPSVDAVFIKSAGDLLNFLEEFRSKLPLQH